MIPIHPAANNNGLRPLGPQSFEALVEDIRRHGMQVPLVLWRDPVAGLCLLDGRHRLRAAEIAIGPVSLVDETLIARSPDEGAVPLPTTIALGDPFDMVESLNLHRRHLNAAQKREVVADRLRQDPTQSNRLIAAATQVDDKTVAAVRADLVATAEIPQVSATVGADGKTRRISQLGLAYYSQVEREKQERDAKAKRGSSDKPPPASMRIPVMPTDAARVLLAQLGLSVCRELVDELRRHILAARPPEPPPPVAEPGPVLRKSGSRLPARHAPTEGA